MRREALKSLMLSALCLTLAILARFSPSFCTWHAEQIFPRIQNAFYWLNRTWSAWPILAALPLLLYLLRRRQLIGIRLLQMSLLLLAGFCTLWLPLYGAAPQATTSTIDLQAVTQELVSVLNQSSTFSATCLGTLDEQLQTAAYAAADHFNLPMTQPHAVDGDLLLNGLGIAGLYNPFTGRTLINTDDRPLLIPFTICHELAHQAGIAHEAQANWEALLLCRQIGGAFKDSAHLSLLLYGMELLSERDPYAWQQVYAQMNEAVRREFIASNGLNTAQPSLLRQLSQRISNLFMRLCGEESGLDSYREVLYSYDG